MGTTGLTAAEWGTMVGLKKGFFRQYGIDLQDVAANAPNNVQALIGGSIQMVSSAPDSVILPIEHGANLVAVGGESLAVFRLIGARGVSSISDLRGKTLSASRANGPDVAILRELLGGAGIKPAEYQFVYAGGSGPRLAAVQNGGAAATLLVPPEDLRAIGGGLVDLGLATAKTKPLLLGGFFVSRDWATTHRQALVSTLRGYDRALTWLNDPANKDEASSILASYTKLDIAVAQKTYDEYVVQAKGFSAHGELNQQAFQDVMENLADFGQLKRPLPPLSK
ncbi:MAG: ABC transporter substrate-binding protein, partial [Chloroflexota bacterium]|nr:ABC transporter substrate-binding protein [Chloroflexota bacterium]